jgi:hypothetical protein
MFSGVHTAIEVDAGGGAAQDCVVFPQRVEVNSGAGLMKLPTALSNSGLVLLGSRKLTNDSAKGVFLPPRANTGGNPLPSLSGDDAGYTLFDMTNKVLRIWDGAAWV